MSKFEGVFSILWVPLLALAVGCEASPVPIGPGGAGGHAGAPVLPIMTSPDGASSDGASSDGASSDVATEGGGDSKPVALPDAGSTDGVVARDGAVAGDGATDA